MYAVKTPYILYLAGVVAFEQPKSLNPVDYQMRATMQECVYQTDRQTDRHPQR